MRTPRGFELVYSTDIHPVEGWAALLDTLQHCGPELKQRLSPSDRFGLGLRLSNDNANDLLTGNNLNDLREFLSRSGLYVALIGGNTYGRLHECQPKENVFVPDWQSEERVEYTLRLLTILSALLPDGLHGGISTCGLCYSRGKSASPPDWNALIRNMTRVAGALVKVKREQGRLIHLDVEPEPDCLIETVPGFIQFFKDLLRVGAPLLAKAEQISRTEAEEAIREHITLCYDLSHSAIAGEDSDSVLRALEDAGVCIGRMQISSALKVGIPSSRTEREELRKNLLLFAEPEYLHQVIGDNERYPDLDAALAHLDRTTDSEWRIHYHVPLYVRDYGPLASTQTEVRDVLSTITTREVHHLEIDTFTWDVLPEDLKLDVVASIEREYRWVLSQL
jgi:hypothetical protein